MEEKIIITRRGVFGRVNVTLPLPVKSSLMDFQKRSGYKKAEFLRMALITGYITMARNLENSNKENNNASSQQPARKE